jgi:SH3-like domain-containing protein
MRAGAASLAMALALCAGEASGLEYRSIAADAAVLYDAPSRQARKMFILSRGYPVEMLVPLEGWSKVRDATGELAWIETKDLSTRRMVMVRVARAEVRAAPEDSAPLAFHADRDVVLELLAVEGNYVKVRHADGAIGYVRVTQVWGL